MKYLLVLLVVVIAVSVWRNKRKFEAPARPAAKPNRSQLQHMVVCAHCGLHLPQTESVQDQSGAFFCSAEHRAQGAQSSRRS